MKEKKKNYLWKCTKRNVYLFILQIIFAYILAQIMVEGSAMVADAVDALDAGKSVDFKQIVSRMILFTVVGFLCGFLRSLCVSYFCLNVQTQYKATVAKKLYRLEYKYFDENSSGSVINKVNADIAEIDSLLGGSLPDIVAMIASVITYAVYIGKLNIKLLLLMLVSYPVVLIISNNVAKKLESLRKVHRQKSDDISTVSQDATSGILVLRSFGIEDYFKKKLGVAADALVENEEKRTRISNRAILFRRLLDWIPNIACCVYAYVLVSKGQLSIGGLLAFVIMLNRFVENFVGIPFVFVDVREQMVCVKRVEVILNEKEEASGIATEGLDQDIAVEFKNIQFGYDENQKILDDLSFKVKKGSSVAFVGESGGGKSTIFRLLCGFYKANGGEYKLFGKNYDEWDVDAARENMALVSQNVFLFPTTIEENVAYGNLNATKEDIVNACKSANIHDFIMGLPDGYDTVVGERGILLSGGEKQRVSIARAILKDASILLLDEPTSAVDVPTEKLIQEAIDKLSANRTTITIAHRLSTIINVDTIMVLKDGKIVEQGSHKELINSNGYYAKMYGKEREVASNE